MKKPPEPKCISDDLWRWCVYSFTNAREKGELKEYLVELRTEHGLNNCSCPHFQNRLLQHYTIPLKSGVPIKDIKENLQYCKHLILAEKAWTKLMMEAMMKRSDKGL